MASSLVSMTLTSAPHRRGTPKTNRGISTILKGASRVGSLMSALWTLGGGRDRLRGALEAKPGANYWRILGIVAVLAMGLLLMLRVGDPVAEEESAA